jgi:hypothetical protein
MLWCWGESDGNGFHGFTWRRKTRPRSNCPSQSVLRWSIGLQLVGLGKEAHRPAQIYRCRWVFGRQRRVLGCVQFTRLDPCTLLHAAHRDGTSMKK